MVLLRTGAKVEKREVDWKQVAVQRREVRSDWQVGAGEKEASWVEMAASLDWSQQTPFVNIGHEEAE